MMTKKWDLVRFLCTSGFLDFGGGLGPLSGDFGGAGVPSTLVGKTFQASSFQRWRKLSCAELYWVSHESYVSDPFFTPFLPHFEPPKMSVVLVQGQ